MHLNRTAAGGTYEREQPPVTVRLVNRSFNFFYAADV